MHIHTLHTHTSHIHTACMPHTHTHSLAVSTFSPVSSLSSNDLRTCAHVLAYTTDIAQNELICGYVSVVHTSSSFRTHTHILIPFEDCELTGLKVDIGHSLAHTHACTHYTHTHKYTPSLQGWGVKPPPLYPVCFCVVGFCCCFCF